MYKIYTLSCPNTKEVKYVGLTKKKLFIRLISHINDKSNLKKYNWINSITDKGGKIKSYECGIFCDTKN